MPKIKKNVNVLNELFIWDYYCFSSSWADALSDNWVADRTTSGSFTGKVVELFGRSSSSENGDTGCITNRSESPSFNECERRMDIGVDDRLGITDVLLLILLIMDDVLFPLMLYSIPVEPCFLSENWPAEDVLLCLDRDEFGVYVSVGWSPFPLDSIDATACWDARLPLLDIAEEYDVLVWVARLPGLLNGVLEENDIAGEIELLASVTKQIKICQVTLSSGNI